jgi:hypothetical protein
MQLEDVLLSEVNQAQENKQCMFSLVYGRQIQKINIYTKIIMILSKLICRTDLKYWNYSMELGE